MAIAEYADLDGLALGELVKNGDIKPIELVEEAIRRAEQLNPTLNFVVYRDYERARRTARRELPKGPFMGVPFFLKDIFGLAEGLPRSAASSLHDVVGGQSGRWRRPYR